MSNNRSPAQVEYVTLMPTIRFTLRGPQGVQVDLNLEEARMVYKEFGASLKKAEQDYERLYGAQPMKEEG